MPVQISEICEQTKKATTKNYRCTTAKNVVEFLTAKENNPAHFHQAA
jgi:hypothetical protein